MFDKLVESNTTGAEIKNRSRYFLVSSVVVGILFLTAVVYSLYAAEIGIGNGNLDISELVAPLESSEPERPEPVRNQSTSSDNNTRTSRQVLMVSTSIPLAPTGVSTERNPHRSIDPSKFTGIIGPGSESDAGSVGAKRIGGGGTGSNIAADESDELEIAKTTPPPTTKPKPPIIKSEGVINGKATYLPVPAYPAAAKAVNAYGTVNVQVTIDETGKVISAKAVNGHPLLKTSAEKAAWAAKFSPTYLSRVAVKVTGVILYDFKRN